MKRLYYLQQKVGMTNAEATALGTLLGLFLLGMGVKHVGAFEPPFDEAIYAEVDSLFALGVSRLQNPLTGSHGLVAESVTEADATSQSDATSASRNSPSRRAAAPPIIGTIDLNAAGRAELQRLPGIGPALADRIIDHRSVHGPFMSVGQLTSVSGIGPKTLERLRPHVSVSSPPLD